MRGKIGLVVGLGAGYVLGTRAGRQRYEQIKAQAQRLWETEPVQKQVTRVTDFAASTAMAVPRAAWNGIVKLVHVVSRGSETPGQKLDAGIDAVSDAVDDAKKTVKKAVS